MAGCANGRAARTRAAINRAADLLPIIADIRVGGAASLRAVAAELQFTRHPIRARRRLVCDPSRTCFGTLRLVRWPTTCWPKPGMKAAPCTPPTAAVAKAGRSMK